MKTSGKILSLIFALVLLSSFTLSATTVVGYSQSDMGKYWLKKAANHMVVDGQEVDTYVIHYDNLETPVYVGILKPHKDCTEFVVRSDGFEVLYTCRKGKFGIEYVPKKYATLSQDEARKAINRTNFLYQRVITQTPQSEKNLLKLIACYVPEVMS